MPKTKAKKKPTPRTSKQPPELPVELANPDKHKPRKGKHWVPGKKPVPIPGPSKKKPRGRLPQVDLDTDPNRVTHAVERLVTPSLANAWIVKPGRRMCIRFDVVNPLMQFKKGTKRSDDDPFPRYCPNPEQDPNVTEIDADAQPYEPQLPECRWYMWEVDFPLEKFLQWGPDELFEVTYKTKRKLPGRKAWSMVERKKKVPVIYARLLHQFCYESHHGELNDAHEAVRRMAYAQRMLDAFGRELEGYRGAPKDFRSKSFTPVLQRQLRGIPDDFPAPIEDFIARSRPGYLADIAQTTEFYLRVDPTLPALIPYYRRNLIYIREAMWHLGVLFGTLKIDSAEDFGASIASQQTAIRRLKDPDEPDRFLGTTAVNPNFSLPEYHLIFKLALEPFFEAELKRLPERLEAMEKLYPKAPASGQEEEVTTTGSSEGRERRRSGESDEATASGSKSQRAVGGGVNRGSGTSELKGNRISHSPDVEVQVEEDEEEAVDESLEPKGKGKAKAKARGDDEDDKDVDSEGSDKLSEDKADEEMWDDE